MPQYPFASILCARSNILEHITAEYALSAQTAISFAYCSYRTPGLQDNSQILAALIKQLCRKKDSIPPWLLKFKHDSLSPSTASTPDTFISLAKGFEKVFVVIDALDECPKRERPDIIGSVIKIVNALPCIKVFITSRRELDIVDVFENGSTPTIQIKAESVAEDIELYVREEVMKLRKGHYGKRLWIESNELEEKITSTLTKKAEGMLVVFSSKGQ